MHWPGDQAASQTSMTGARSLSSISTSGEACAVTHDAQFAHVMRWFHSKGIQTLKDDKRFSVSPQSSHPGSVPISLNSQNRGAYTHQRNVVPPLQSEKRDKLDANRPCVEAFVHQVQFLVITFIRSLFYCRPEKPVRSLQTFFSFFIQKRICRMEVPQNYVVEFRIQNHSWCDPVFGLLKLWLPHPERRLVLLRYTFL